MSPKQLFNNVRAREFIRGIDGICGAIVSLFSKIANCTAYNYKIKPFYNHLNAIG